MAPQRLAGGGAGHGAAFPVLTPLLESWHRIVLVFVVAGITTFVVRQFVVAGRYEARSTLMTVSSQRTISGSGNLAALAMLSGQGAGSTPPDLVAQVLVARHVLLKIGLSRVDSSAPVRIIDRLRGESRADVDMPEVQRAVARALSVSIDRKTGLLDVMARDRDSALVRLLVTRDVEIGTAAFATMMRAQASAQRAGQEARVRLTASQLREAEARQLNFLRSNRVTSAFSVSALEQQSIQRDIQIAQQAYTEAVSAREAAYARELEETPAVVVVDPVPTVLPKVPKYSLFYSLAVAVFAAFVYGTVVLTREQLVSMQAAADPRARRFIESVRRVPVIGRLAPRE